MSCISMELICFENNCRCINESASLNPLNYLNILIRDHLKKRGKCIYSYIFSYLKISFIFLLNIGKVKFYYQYESMSSSFDTWLFVDEIPTFIFFRVPYKLKRNHINISTRINFDLSMLMHLLASISLKRKKTSQSILYNSLYEFVVKRSATTT